MATSKKSHIIDPLDEGVDPRLAVLAAIREQLPEGGDDAAAPAKTEAPKAGAKAQAQAPAVATVADTDLQAALRRLEERAKTARQEAEARLAEANGLRQRLGELARERGRLAHVARRAQALAAWAGEEARALAEQAEARMRAIEEEMDAIRIRLQEMEADQGIRLLRAEEAARAEAEKAKAQAEQARQLAREGKLAEALASLPARPEEGSPVAEARQELLRTAHRVVGNAIFRAREALAAGEAERALKEIQGVARLLPHVRGEDRRAAHGVFCQAVHRLAPPGQPLVVIRGRRLARRGRLTWTAPPGAIAVGTPLRGAARVLYDLGTPWKEGAFVRAEEADIQPLRTRHGAEGNKPPAPCRSKGARG
ncbi:hypothetical protein HRbin24_00053 [bacterium HR24]|nr:hypothetical protein HRbin24_00053 [bacterium HR24]